jgi:hypothetical protein
MHSWIGFTLTDRPTAFHLIDKFFGGILFSLPHDELITLSGRDNLLCLPMAMLRVTGYFLGS